MANPIVLTSVARAGSSVLLDILGHDPARPTYLHEPLSVGALGFSRDGLWRYANPMQGELLQAAVKLYFGAGICPMASDPQFDALDTIREDTTRLQEYLRVVMVQDSTIKFINLLFRLGWFLHTFPDPVVVVLVRSPMSFAQSVTSMSRRGTEQGQGPIWLDSISCQIAAHGNIFSRFHPEPRWTVFHHAMYVWEAVHRHMLALVRWSGQRHRIVVVRYEDLCLCPMRELERIYELLDEPVPSEVLQRIATTSTNRPDAWFGQQLYNPPRDYVQRGEGFWTELLEEFQLENLMHQCGYFMPAACAAFS